MTERGNKGNHTIYGDGGDDIVDGGEDDDEGGALLSGTSYAVPFVTAAFARAMLGQERETPLLRGQAVPLISARRDATRYSAGG